MSNFYFPVNNIYQIETPVWLRLTYYDYDTYFQNRGSRSVYLTVPPKKTFWLPLPSAIGSSARIKATDDASVLSGTRTGMMDPSTGYISATTNSSNTRGTPMGGNIFHKEEGYATTRDGTILTNHESYGRSVGGIFGRVAYFPNPDIQIKGTLATTGINNEGYVDIQDTAWFGQNKKSYSFNFSLKAKSVVDSEAAIGLCNEMSNLVLPSIIRDPDPKPYIIYNQPVRHPGVWQIQAISNAVDVTEGWIGRYPQPCIMMSVNAQRVGPNDEGSVSGMLNDDIIIPISYILNVQYQEIEPTYIDGDDNTQTYGLRRSAFYGQ